jgi:adenosylmethionine-8-amino-7-oxononanoate aminotransferase
MRPGEGGQPAREFADTADARHRDQGTQMNEPVVDRDLVSAASSAVFHRELDKHYPRIARGSGVCLYDTGGNRYLDASSGAMIASLGHGYVPEIHDAIWDQYHERVSYAYSDIVTSVPHEELAAAVVAVAPEGFTRVRLMTEGTAANEMAGRLARAYHVERGDPGRHLIFSAAQNYHGASMFTLSLTDRPGLQEPYRPYMVPQPHFPPSTWRTDPSGQTAVAALYAELARVGPENVAAIMLEPVSAMALPAYSPPLAVWQALADIRQEHGILIIFDEVVTGFGRTGAWFAAARTPLLPDIITFGKGLGAGFFPVAGMLAADHVYQAIAKGSRVFDHGHGWDGAPVSSVAGLAVLTYLREHQLVEEVARRGPLFLSALKRALDGLPVVAEVRGRGFLLGVSYAQPGDPMTLLDPDLKFAQRVDAEAARRGLLVRSTHPNADGYTGDQTLLAPPFITTDEEWAEMTGIFADTVGTAAAQAGRSWA